jgi:hypothetical protein
MRTMTTVGAVLLLAVGVGRGDPPSAPASPSGPALASPPLPSLPPIPPANGEWKKAERIDTPAPPPAADHKAPAPAPAEKNEKPDAKKLKEEMEKLLKEQNDKLKDKGAADDERTRLHNKLNELVEKIDQQKKTPKPATPPKTPDPHDTHTPPPPKTLVPEGGKPIDLVRAAGNLFKAGDADSALELLKVDTTQLPKEDRAFADYLRAACLRKQGKTTEAVKLYRAIADAKDDPFLAESAVTQITAIKSAQELETQLTQLKSRRNPK